MRHVDLFSGIGGFAVACSWAWGDEYENVGHSEVEEYPCKVYHRHFPGSPCLGDITKIEWQEGQADIVTGGFPCQPHSVAGKRKGAEDARDLWGECVRCIRIVRPKYALFENVPGIFVSNGGRFFNRVLYDLAEIGYDAEWTVLSAASVGAPHRRERVWILCYPQTSQNPLGGRRIHRGDEEGRDGFRQQRESGAESGVGILGEGETVVNAAIIGQQNPKSTENRRSKRGRRRETPAEGGGRGQWSTEPTLGMLVNGLSPGLDVAGLEDEYIRVATGVPERANQLKGLGNAIVPQAAYQVLLNIRRHLESLEDHKGSDD